MMKFYIIKAHPEENSFNSSLTKESLKYLKSEGHEVKFNDLYKNSFNPLMSREDFPKKENQPLVQFPNAQLEAYQSDQTSIEIKIEQDNIMWSDIIILQFPLWLYGMPAILKGWCERILSEGFAHRPSENIWFNNSKLNKKKLLLSITTNGRKESFSNKGRHGSLDIILWPIINSFAYSGFNIIKPFIAFDVVRSSDDQRKIVIQNLKEYLSKINNLPLVEIHNLDDYKKNGTLKEDIKAKTAGQQKPEDFIK